MESLTAEEREIIKAGSLITSIKTVRCKKRHVNVGRIRPYCRMRCLRILSDLRIASNLRPDKAFSQHPALIVGCDACALIRPTNRIEP